MTVWISIIVCFLIGLLIVKLLDEGWYDFEYFMGGSTGALIGLILGIFIAFKIGKETTNCVSELNLVNLQDGSSLKGDFYLGSGSIDGRMKYTFYYEVQGGFKMMQLDYEYVEIRYTTETPKVITYEICETENPKNYWGMAYGIGFKSYIIEVPKGSIKSNFTLDAQ